MDNKVSARQRMEFALRNVYGPKQRRKAAAWIVEFVGINEEQDLGEKAVESLIDRYHVATHLPRPGVFSENVKRVREILSQKYGYVNHEELRKRDAGLALWIDDLTMRCEWRGDFIQNQTMSDSDLSFCANTLWRHRVYPALTDDDKTEIKERIQERASVEYDPKELPAMILQVLRNSLGEYTYNQLSSEMGIAKDWKAVDRVLRQMAQDPLSPIVRWESRETVGNGSRRVKTNNKGNRITLYKWSPERKAINNCPARTNELVSTSLVKVIAATPGSGLNTLHMTIRQMYGYIDERIINRCLENLLISKSIIQVAGRQRAKLHYLIEDAPSAVEHNVRKTHEGTTQPAPQSVVQNAAKLMRQQIEEAEKMQQCMEQISSLRREVYAPSGTAAVAIEDCSDESWMD